jgi:hypothetical protein
MEPGFELGALRFIKQALYGLSHTSSSFYSGYFFGGEGVSQTICLGWPGADSPELTFPSG